MGIVKGVAKAFRDAANQIHGVSEQDKLELREELEELRAETIKKALDYDKRLLAAQAKEVSAHFSPKTWVQKNWKQVAMRIIVTLAVLEACGMLPMEVPKNAWGILEMLVASF